MNKKLAVIIPLLSISVVFALGYRGFGWKERFQNNQNRENDNNDPIAPLVAVSTVPSTPVTVDLPNTPRTVAWQVFQNYLEFARTHNLQGIKSLSYQMSATCLDPAKEKECFALMDGVYNIASSFKIEDFKNIQLDERQIILFTDIQDNARAALFFVRDENGTPKMLGLRFCGQEEGRTDKCVDPDPNLRDKDNDGWWDNVQSLFY